MKISNLIILSILLTFIPAYSYSQDSMGEGKGSVTPYEKEKPEEKINSTPSQDNSVTQAESQPGTEQEEQVYKQIKTSSMCIGKDCRTKWPVLKCANYDGRPAGETGDEFCGQMNQSCMAVSMGGGQSFFDQCSVPTSSVHRCRCCWVE